MSARFHALWLRDNALDPETRSPGNGQRLITVLDIPRDTRIADAAVTAAGRSAACASRPEGKDVTFPAAWLRARRYDRERSASGRLDLAGDSSSGTARLQAQRARRLAIRTDRRGPRRRSGAGSPRCAATASRCCATCRASPAALCEVAELFGYVRETNYGRWFEVRAEVNPNNLAYTNLGLQAHTDNPYRDPVPTLQILACLENSVEGGEFDRGRRFRASRARLQAENPRGFELLTRYLRALRICRLGRRAAPRAKRPIIELGAGRRADRHPLQQPLRRADRRRALSTTWRISMPPIAASPRSSRIRRWR